LEDLDLSLYISHYFFLKHNVLNSSDIEIIWTRFVQIYMI
jgi:hypothetical protein